MLSDIAQSAQNGELNGVIDTALKNAGVNSFTQPLASYSQDMVAVKTSELAPGIAADLAKNITEKLANIGQGIA